MLNFIIHKFLDLIKIKKIILLLKFSGIKEIMIKITYKYYLPLLLFLISSCSSSVGTNNEIPISIANDDLIVKSNEVITLDGTKSFDPEQLTLRYSWKLITKPKNSLATITSLSENEAISSFIPDVVGEYVVELIVNDGVNDSRPDIVYIQRQNNKPSALAGKNRAVTLNTQVLLDGSGSTDTDNQILNYNWVLISKPQGSLSIISQNNITDSNVSFFADTVGEYVFELSVYDGFVTSANDTIKIYSYNGTIVYFNDFSSSELSDFVIRSDGVSTALIENEQLRLNPGNGPDNSASVSLDTRTLLSSYLATLKLNSSTITWAFNVSNIDGNRNNSFSFLISNKAFITAPENFHYSFIGGGFVDSRMMLRREAMFNSPFGNVSEILIDITNGLGNIPSIGAIKITYNPLSDEWKLYYEESNKKLNPVLITKLIGSTKNSGFANELLPYFIFHSNTTGSVFFDNFTVLVN